MEHATVPAYEAADQVEQSVGFDLRIFRLPKPLVVALLPWWCALVPAVFALTTGRPWLALLLMGGGMLFSVAAVAAVLVASAESSD